MASSNYFGISDAFVATLGGQSFSGTDPELWRRYAVWQQQQAQANAPAQQMAGPMGAPEPFNEQEADSENFLSAGPGTYGAGADSGLYAKSDWNTPQGQNNPSLSQANPWASSGGHVDPNESVANQPGYAGPNSAAGANPWSSTSLGFAGYSQPGSGTTGAGGGGGGGGGGASASGGYNSQGGGGGSSTTRPMSSAMGARGLDQSDVDKVMARMDNMFTSLSNRASQRADAAMANFRGDPAGQAARQYLTDTFAQGLTTGMADEYAGRLRNAQAARGMSFGGASSRDEAAMLMSMSEKRRETLLPQMLKDSMDTAMLPAQLEAAYAANYGAAAKSSVNDASVYLDALKARTGTGGGGSTQYATMFRNLFGA
jgi:hypothetical protein